MTTSTLSRGAWFGGDDAPGVGDEAWLYTPVADISSRLVGARPAGRAEPGREVVEELAGRHGETRIVLVNGIHSPTLSDREHLPAGLHLDADPGSGDAVQLSVDPATCVEPVVHVVHLAAPSGDLVLSRPRLAVEVGAGSRLHLIESFVGLPGGALTEASTTVRVAEDAELTHERVQSEPEDAVHVARLVFEQRARSRVRSSSVTRGADVARLGLDVVLGAEDASCDLSGLYLPTDTRRHDTVVTVDHAASRCTSRQLFKGVVDDRARGSFSGHVIVRHGTVATEAHQTNRNLLLTPTAQADSRPWLEIFADDVRCDHGSATGRLDEDALFYLRSRGIPRHEARAMLVEAFVREITERITTGSLRTHVDHLLGLEPAP